MEMILWTVESFHVFCELLDSTLVLPGRFQLFEKTQIPIYCHLPKIIISKAVKGFDLFRDGCLFGEGCLFLEIHIVEIRWVR